MFLHKLSQSLQQFAGIARLKTQSSSCDILVLDGDETAKENFEQNCVSCMTEQDGERRVLAGKLCGGFGENVVCDVVLLMEERQELFVQFLDSCILAEKTCQLNQLSQNVVGLSFTATTLQFFLQTFEDCAQNLGKFLQCDLRLRSIYHHSQVDKQNPVYDHIVMVGLLLDERNFH